MLLPSCYTPVVELLLRNGFRMESIIATSQYGKVFKVKSGDETLCAKISFTCSRKLLDNSILEIELAKQLQNELVQEYVTSFSTDRFQVLITKLYKCDMLTELISIKKRKHELKEAEILEIVSQVYAGVSFINSNGYYVSDLCLENIVVESCPPEGPWKIRLIDLGALYKWDEVYSNIGKLSENQVRQAYRPPEFKYMSESTNFKEAQVYSIGSIMYMMSVLTPPYLNINDQNYHRFINGNYTLNHPTVDALCKATATFPDTRVKFASLGNKLRPILPSAEECQFLSSPKFILSETK